jgi:DNA-binding transcriptional ArsR family regulator
MRKQATRDFMRITKAPADENRVRMLPALLKGELCVCQITEMKARDSEIKTRQEKGK